jgi:2-polyprenyl-6-hydroxyphenyl methylase/3-demethylubiquinone-9 3-methyltransferase
MGFVDRDEKCQKMMRKMERFDFGQNWARFLQGLDEDRIREAERSLKEMLHVNDLGGKRLLDVGSGSGLFSLAARRLGADVVSFDCDPLCVLCTKELMNRFFAEGSHWRIEQGSVLDESFLKSLGQFDVVYAWGVLHHTGAMWKALENIIPLVSANGKIFLSIYNDQGFISRYWRKVKKAYNTSCKPVKWLIVLSVGAVLESRNILVRLMQGENPLPFKYWHEKKRSRGMSAWYDLVDWVGGFPFEVAKPEEIFDFYREKGFLMTKLKTCRGGLGCNEFVFVREAGERESDTQKG